MLIVIKINQNDQQNFHRRCLRCSSRQWTKRQLGLCHCLQKTTCWPNSHAQRLDHNCEWLLRRSYLVCLHFHRRLRWRKTKRGNSHCNDLQGWIVQGFDWLFYCNCRRVCKRYLHRWIMRHRMKNVRQIGLPSLQLSREMRSSKKVRVPSCSLLFLFFS